MWEIVTIRKLKIDEMRGAGIATPEAYPVYDEGDAGAPATMQFAIFSLRSRPSPCRGEEPQGY